MLRVYPKPITGLIFIYVSIYIINTSGEYIKKSISLNNKNYEILGSRLTVEGNSVNYFARIPYAKPPINKLRFKHPQEIEGDPWTGVYNATMQPNTCWQAEAGEFDKLNAAAKLWLSTTSMNEDCLYLTIWAPSASDKKYSVMVWIYGGAFLSGSSTLEVYDGSILAAKHNVVIVSMQYRLGPLGFLYLDDKTAPGNQGLMDQVMALKWVKNNIHNFNGNSDSITIFGESAGSVSVSLHVLSPISQIYFNRAIMESATSLANWGIETKDKSKVKAVQLAKFVNCESTMPDRLVKCLQDIDPRLLVDKQYELKSFIGKQRSKLLYDRGIKHIYTDASFFIDIFFQPIFDGYFVPKPIDQLMKETTAKKPIELMMGFNANEGMFFLLYGLNKWLKFFNKDKVEDNSFLSSNHPNYTKVSKFIVENLLTKEVSYPDLLPLLLYEYKIPSSTLGWRKWGSKQVLHALDQLTGDQQFVCPVIDYAELMADKNNTVYLYSFLHRTDNSTFPKWTGAMHGFEIEYIFGMPFSETFIKRFYSFTAEEKQLSEYVMKMWTNFAINGNPTPQALSYFDKTVQWPSYNTTSRMIFLMTTSGINNMTPIQESEKSQKCKFWNKVIPSITSLLKDSNWSSLNQMRWLNIVIILKVLWFYSAEIL